MIQLNPFFSRNNFNNKSSRAKPPKPFSCGIDNGFEKKHQVLTYSGMASPSSSMSRVLIKTLQKVVGLNKVTRRAGIAVPPLRYASLKVVPLRGVSSKIGPGSTFILNSLGRATPERDTNVCFTSTNMEQLLGSFSIIKRQFHSKKPTLPQPFGARSERSHPTNLGLDLTSTEKEKFNNKNEALKDKTLVYKRLSHTVVKSDSTIGKVALKSEIKTPCLPAKSLKEQTKMASPITDEWLATLIPGPKKRGTLSLKTLYKRRSIYNYFETTSGLSTSDPSLKSNVIGELSKNKTDSGMASPSSSMSTEGSYKRANRNRRGRDKSWIFKNLWTNKFTQIKERVSRLRPARASMLEDSMLGDSYSYNYNKPAQPEAIITKGWNTKAKLATSKKIGNTSKSPSSPYNSELFNNNNKSPKWVEAQDFSTHKEGSNSTLHFFKNPYTLKKLFVSYLKQRKLNILNKHNGMASPARERGTFLASSKVVSYSFSKISGATNSISISTPNQTGATPPSYHQRCEDDMILSLSAPYPGKESATFKSLYKLLKSFFKSVKSLISYPILNVSPNKLIINLFYYVKPTRKKMKEHKKYQKYIRKQGKLFQENLLRSKFSKLKHRFNFILFLNKFERVIISKSNKMLPDTNSQYQINNQGGRARSERSHASEARDFIGPFSLGNIKINIKMRASALVWEENFIRLRLIINLFSQLKSEQGGEASEARDANLKESRFSSMYHFYLNHIKQLDHPTTRSLSELNKGPDASSIFDEASDILRENIPELKEGAPSHVENLKGVDEAEILSLKLDNLEKLVNLLDTDLRPLNGKLLKDLTVNKDELILLKEQTRQGLNEILILLKELEFELLTKKPINNNCPNPYANKNIRLLLINTLHELYRNTLRLYFYFFKDYTDRSQPTFRLKNGCADMKATPLQNPGQFKPLKKRISVGEASEAIDVVLTQPFKEGLRRRSQLILKVKTTPSATLIDNNQGGSNSQGSLKGEGSLSPSQVVRKLNQGLGKARATQPGLATHTGRDLPTIVSLNLYKFKFLIYFLEKLFNKPIELNLIRLKYPYHESNILAQVLALSSKKYKFFLIMRKLFYTASIKHPGKSSGLVKKGFEGGYTDMFKIIPSYLSGLKVRLAGRLLTEKLVPRKTVKTFQVGSLSRGKVNFKTTSRITLKNKRGAYSFTVTTSHILANSTRPS